MKYFVVFAVVLCVAVSADEKEELRTKVLGCIKDSKIPIESLIERCSKEVVADSSDIDAFKDLLGCTYEVFGVIKQNGAGVDTHTERAALLVPAEKKEKILEILSGCSGRAKALSTVRDAAFELYTCFREMYKEEYAMDCQSIIKALL